MTPMRLGRARCLVMPLTIALVVVTGCAGADNGPDPTVTARPSQRPAASGSSAPGAVTSAVRGGITLPPTAGRFDYQIGGAYTPDAEVAIVERDRRAEPVPGRYNVCYVNAFQTQPDERAFWTSDHSDLLLRRANGALWIDPGWPNEVILDISTPAKQQAVAAIVGEWIAGCAQDGFQAVEPDNLDTWTRSDGRLSAEDALAVARLLTQTAHAHHLAIAQKNAGELGTAGREAGFDFAVAEECQVYDECSDYTDVYGRAVVEVEYSDQDPDVFRAACAERGKDVSVLRRDRDVVPRGDPDYRYEVCP